MVGTWGRGLVIGFPLVFLLVFFMLPFLVVMKISVSEMDNVVFKDLLTWSDGVLGLKIKLNAHAGISSFSSKSSTFFGAYCSQA